MWEEMKCDGPLLYFSVCGNVSEHVEREREKTVSALNLVWHKNIESLK